MTYSAIQPVHDPVSLLNLFDIGAERSNRSDYFRTLAERTFDLILQDNPAIRSDGDVYKFYPLLLGFVKDRIRIMPGMRERPAFWRTLCAWAHTSQLMQLLRGFTIHYDRWEPWLHESFDVRNLMALYLELFELPMSRDYLADNLYLKAFMMGGLLRVMQGYEDNHPFSQKLRNRCPELFVELKKTDRLLDVLYAFPLDLHLRPRDLPAAGAFPLDDPEKLFDRVRERITSDLRSDVWPYLDRICGITQLPTAIRTEVLSALKGILVGEGEKVTEEDERNLLHIAGIAQKGQDNEIAEELLRICHERFELLSGKGAVVAIATTLITACAVLGDRTEKHKRLAALLLHLCSKLSSVGEVSECDQMLFALKALVPVQYWYASQAQALARAVTLPQPVGQHE